MLAAFRDDEARRTMERTRRSGAAPAGRFRIRRRAVQRLGPCGYAISDSENPLLATPEITGETAWWMLSLFHPGAVDAVDWQRGNYSLTTRGGRVESDRLGRCQEADSHGRGRLGASCLHRSRAARQPMSRPRIFRIPSIAPDSRWRFPFRSGGGRRHEIPRYLPDADAGRRRPEALSHRLHGLEGPRQCARPAPHFPPAGKRSAPGRLSGAVEESRKARFRVVGRLRAEFRRPAHSLRTSKLDPLLGKGPGARISSSRPSPSAPAARMFPRPRSRARCEPAPFSIAGRKPP